MGCIKTSPIIYFFILLLITPTASAGWLEDLYDEYVYNEYKLGDTTQLEKLNDELNSIPWNATKKIDGVVYLHATLQGYNDTMCNNTTCWTRNSTDYEEDLMYKLGASTIPATSKKKYKIESTTELDRVILVGNDTITTTLDVSVKYIVEVRKTWCIEVGNKTKCIKYWDWDGEYLYAIGNISDTITKPKKPNTHADNLTVIGNGSYRNVESPLFENQFGFHLEGIENNTANNMTDTLKWIVGEETNPELRDVYISAIWIKPKYEIENTEHLYVGRLVDIPEPEINREGMSGDIDVNNKTIKSLMMGRVELTNASIMTPYGMESLNISSSVTEKPQTMESEAALMTLFAIILLGILLGIIFFILMKVPEVIKHGF